MRRARRSHGRGRNYRGRRRGSPAWGDGYLRRISADNLRHAAGTELRNATNAEPARLQDGVLGQPLNRVRNDRAEGVIRELAAEVEVSEAGLRLADDLCNCVFDHDDLPR